MGKSRKEKKVQKKMLERIIMESRLASLKSIHDMVVANRRFQKMDEMQMLVRDAFCRNLKWMGISYDYRQVKGIAEEAINEDFERNPDRYDSIPVTTVDIDHAINIANQLAHTVKRGAFPYGIDPIIIKEAI